MAILINDLMTAAVDYWPLEDNEQCRLLQADRDWWISQYEEIARDLEAEKKKATENELNRRESAFMAEQTGKVGEAQEALLVQDKQKQKEKEQLVKGYESQVFELKEKLKVSEEQIEDISEKWNNDQKLWKEEADRSKKEYESQLKLKDPILKSIQRE